MKYTGWTLNFHCAVDMVETLQQQAKDMEEELQTWEEEVRRARKEYYELNYYTTLQLLTLRQELGKLKISEQPRAHTQINPQVLALLESISTEITSPRVWEVVKNQYDAENWIADNAGQYDSSDDEGGEIDIEEEEESEADSEVEDTLPQATPLQSPIGMYFFVCCNKFADRSTQVYPL